MKHFRNRKHQLTILAAILALTLGVALFQPQRRPSKQIAARPTLDSLSTLLKEADADVEEGRLTDALRKYRQALKIKPSSANAKDGIISIKSKAAEDTSTESPDDQAAAEIAEGILAGDPDIKETEQTGGEANGGAASEGGSENWVPADLNDPSSTPANILPPELPGYKITQNGWLKKPVLAGATYVPRSPAIAKEIDRILLTVGKHETIDQVNKQFKTETERFSVSPRKVSVNDHPATFSLYDESRPDLFPILTSLRWTRGKWFFSVQIAPLMDHQTDTQPSTAFKQGIATDVAEMLGY